MKNAWRVAVSIISSSILAAAVWALPPRATPHQAGATNQQGAAQLQTASGKITSVQGSSFTLEMSGSGPTGQQFQQQQSQPKTMTFTTDKNTTVDGQLKVGSNAEVVYRQDGGNNIAVSVRVTS